jgi:hypothetical protein
MSRKSKTKELQLKHFFTPSMNWIPAFFGGLCVGILIHLIPGMDAILADVKPTVKEEPARPQPVMWRPQIRK